MIKNFLILCILVCGLTACGKYDPAAKYAVTRKTITYTGSYRICVDKLGVARDFNEFWITVTKIQYDSIELGSEWCESPKAIEPGCGGK